MPPDRSSSALSATPAAAKMGTKQSIPPPRVWLILLAPLLPLTFGLSDFAFIRSSPFSDVLITYYPNFIYLRESIASWHAIPLWSPLIFSGYPFFASPLSGLWYPPGWLGLILPLPLAFNLLILAHFLWGGAGVYVLARVEGLGERGALLSALIWETLPKLLLHYGAGHLTLVYSLAWTPWLLAAEALWPRLVPTILALTFLATPQWAGYAFALWLGWSLRHALRTGRLKAIPKWMAQTAWKIGIAILLTCPLLIPLLEYTSLSTRSSLAPSDVLIYSLPPAYILGFFFPLPQPFHEFFIYPGAVSVILAISAGRSLFWGALALAGVVWALGENLPGAYLIASLPGVSLVRVPSRGIFLTSMALALLAGEGVEALIAGASERALKRARLSFVAIPAFGLALAGGLWAIGNETALWVLWGAVAFSLTAFFAWMLTRSGSARYWVLLAAFSVAEALALGFIWLEFLPAEACLKEKAEVAQFLANQPRPFRIYSPSYVIPQQTAALYGLEMANGVDPLHLESYARFMEEATGIPYRRYSVTIPPMGEREDPFTANIGYVPDPRRLGLLNVKYVVSAFPLEVEGLEERARFGEVRVYENLYALPRAWVQDPDKPLGAEVHPVSYWEWSPNRIRLKAEGPGLLIVSEVAYPGWEGYVDGEKRPIEVVGGVLRGLRLEAGEHEVEMRFSPRSLKAGLAGGILGLLLLAIPPLGALGRR